MPDILPPSIAKARHLDPALGDQLADQFSRLLRAAQAVSWANNRLKPSIAASGTSQVLEALVG